MKCCVCLVGESWTDNGTSALLWIVNCLILGFCMVKMFVYGDPVLPSKSKESLNFWRHRRQADDYLSKVATSYKSLSFKLSYFDPGPSTLRITGLYLVNLSIPGLFWY